MADFCKQCSVATFGKDSHDLAGITSPEDQADNLFAVVLCEGCGVTQVDAEGVCIGGCQENHPDLALPGDKVASS